MKTKIFRAFTSLTLAVLFAVCCFSAYAWFVLGDKVNQMEFQFAKVNSVVYFYTAQDSNLNGSPDLISDGYAPTLSADKQTEEAHDIYYKETRYFNYIAREEAKARDFASVEESIAISDFANEVVPSKVFTVKLSLVNKGDSTNNVYVRFNEKKLTDEQQIVMYSALAARVVKVVGAEAMNSTAEPTFAAEEWKMLCDGATMSSDEVTFAAKNVFGEGDTDEIFGMDKQLAEQTNNTGKIVNVMDVWLQLTMIPYDELVSSQEFDAFAANMALQKGIDKDVYIQTYKTTYQSLQGMTSAFDISFSVLFEVHVDN